ncbi:unnamed protein product [Rotaria sp. Silwood2]|nr:unnamed protein product [Rotaria sp. Silwood2]
MQNNRLTSVKQKSVVPSHGSGNSLYSTTESLTAQDIENYFRVKGVLGDNDDETTVSSSINNRLSRLNINRDQDQEHMSDIEGRTDPDGAQSEADKEEIRQILGISHALETFDDYKEIKQWINQDITLSNRDD